MLLLEAALIGVFLALDLILFFIFFEVVLVPMYFLIAGWGHGNRRYAATKFFLFTMAGSAFLFVGILAVAFLHRSSEGFLTFDTQSRPMRPAAAFSSATAKGCLAASRRCQDSCSRSTRGCLTHTDVQPARYPNGVP
jgi:NADH-quinone oxidoreductase subunit M